MQTEKYWSKNWKPYIISKTVTKCSLIESSPFGTSYTYRSHLLIQIYALSRLIFGENSTFRYVKIKSTRMYLCKHSVEMTVYLSLMYIARSDIAAELKVFINNLNRAITKVHHGARNWAHRTNAYHFYFSFVITLYHVVNRLRGTIWALQRKPQRIMQRTNRRSRSHCTHITPCLCICVRAAFRV